MTEKLNTVLLGIITVLLVLVLLRQGRNIGQGRFQSFSENIDVALDTKTGQLCSTLEPRAKIPACTELAKH